MKPGDHPEFFRLPPPAGQSRESGIVLDADGRFWHQGQPVAHPGMARAFASWVTRHPDDGRYILSNGYDWSYFTVEDAPFFVVAVRDVECAPVLVLGSGEEEDLDPGSLFLGPADALYARVKQGAFDSKLTPGAQLSLAPILEQLPDGTFAIRARGGVFPIRRGDLQPRIAAL